MQYSADPRTMPIHGEPMVTANWQQQERPLLVQLRTTKIPSAAAHAARRLTPHEIPYGSLMAGEGPTRQRALLTPTLGARLVCRRGARPSCAATPATHVPIAAPANHPHDTPVNP